MTATQEAAMLACLRRQLAAITAYLQANVWGEEMTEPVHIPLHSAYLCANCQNIGNCTRTCPACGGATVHPIARWLNRDTDAEKGRAA